MASRKSVHGRYGEMLHTSFIIMFIFCSTSLVRVPSPRCRDRYPSCALAPRSSVALIRARFTRFNWSKAEINKRQYPARVVSSTHPLNNHPPYLPPGCPFPTFVTSRNL